jgi:phage baseplate assembly protein W
MHQQAEKFLGTGWSFPPRFNRITNKIEMVAGTKDIEESIAIILRTISGERLMHPHFGCSLHRLVFEKADITFVNEMNRMIYQALLNYEPRIKDIDTEMVSRNVADGVVHVQVSYTIITTNTRHNIVFPFYIDEGTNVNMM